MGRRTLTPYDKKQYLLNINSNGVHDLDNEQVNCQINEIKPEYIEMFETLSEALFAAGLSGKKLNGCYYCLSREDIG